MSMYAIFTDVPSALHAKKIVEQIREDIRVSFDETFIKFSARVHRPVEHVYISAKLVTPE